MMGILTANFKHLYQCRSVWLWYAITLSQLPMVFSSYRKPGRYLGYLIVSYFFGIIAGFMQREIFNRPFSFCLPGHNEVMRKFIFWVGLVVNGLLGFLFLRCPSVEYSSLPLVILAGGVVGMVAYLSFVCIVLSDLHNNKKVLFPLIAISFAGVFFKWDLIVQEMILRLPLVVISLGLLFCWSVWVWLGRKSFSRKYCGKLIMGLFDGWNKKKMVKYKQAQLDKKEKKKCGSIRIYPSVEEFFVSRVSRVESGSLQQYVWGGFYKAFWQILSREFMEWIRILVIISLAICFVCYLPGSNSYIIFFMPGIMVVNMSLNVHSSLLISDGRREKFWSALALAVTVGILISVIVAILAMVTQMMAGVMPPLTIKGFKLVFNALDVKFSVMPLLMVPIVLMIGLIFPRNQLVKMILAMALFQILFVLSIFGKLSILNWPILVVPVLIFNWALFIYVLRYISMRCCLVR